MKWPSLNKPKPMTVDDMRAHFLPVVKTIVAEHGGAAALPFTFIICHRSNETMFKHLRKQGGVVREDYIFEVGDRAKVASMVPDFPADMVPVLYLGSDGQCLLPFNPTTGEYAFQDEVEPDYMLAILEAVRSACERCTPSEALDGPEAPSFFFGHQQWDDFCDTLVKQGGERVGPLVVKVHSREMFFSLGTTPKTFRADLIPVVIGHPEGFMEARGFDPRTGYWGIVEAAPSGTVH